MMSEKPTSGQLFTAAFCNGVSRAAQLASSALACLAQIS